MKLLPNYGKTGQNKHTLTWQVGEECVQAEFCDQIHGSAYSPTNELLLVLTGLEGKNTSDKLHGLRRSGEKIFEVSEPEGYSFYYLSSHIYHETAVVCVSKGNTLDWFFSIDPSSGELKPLNRAY